MRISAAYNQTLDGVGFAERTTDSHADIFNEAKGVAEQFNHCKTSRWFYTPAGQTKAN